MDIGEVSIVGAGPGGCSAALFLAKQGIASTLIDKASFPRDKICGDGISGWVLNILNKLDPDINYQFSKQSYQVPSWGARFVAPNNRVLDVPFKVEDAINENLPAGFVSKRVDFDNFLVEKVRQEPKITLLENTNIKEFTNKEELAQLTDQQGKVIKSKIVIFANGAYSKFSKQLAGIHMEKKHYIAGIRTYYEGVSDTHEQNYIELHFLKNLLPGYFWVFPLPNGQANVGLGMRSDKISKKKINLKKELYQLINTHPILKKRFINAKEIEGPKGFGLPLGSKKRDISGANYMLIGDAASLIDPFTGEGIGNAMASGMYAAQHTEKCLTANDFSASFMKGYDKYTYGKIGSELKLSKLMQDLLNFPWLFSLIVNKAISNQTLRETMSCMLTDMEVRAQLKKPSFYFKVLFG
jgi:geranylgeranyl reductase family protein